MMVADARPLEPTEEPSDVTLTIHIQRPKETNPEGYISMSAEVLTPDGLKYEDAADGKHDQTTMTRVLHDAQNYYANGRKLWVNRVRKHGHDGPSL
jgi:hypothetical protein